MSWICRRDLDKMRDTLETGFYQLKRVHYSRDIGSNKGAKSTFKGIKRVNIFIIGHGFCEIIFRTF